MKTEDVSSYFQLLQTQNSMLSLTNSVSNIHSALKKLHRIIQDCPINLSNPNCLQNDEYQIFSSVLKSLISILLDDIFPPDVILLCCTCIALLTATLFHPEYASSFLIHILCYFGQKKSHNDKDLPKEQVVDGLNSFLLNSSSFYNSFSYEEIFHDWKSRENNVPFLFHVIAVLNGIVSCQKFNLYSFTLNSSQNKPFLILIFDLVISCCSIPSIHQYHAFNVLLNWMRICEMCLPLFPENGDTFFPTHGEIVQETLNLLESNSQSPIKGINGIVKEIYKSLISLFMKECEKFKTDKMELTQYLLKKCLMLGWKIKGKYLLLSVLLQHVDYLEFLQQTLDAPKEIASNLKANYMSSSVAELYKVIVSKMIEKNSIEDLITEWCWWWREPILNCLYSEDRLLIQNLSNTILPWTMKVFPNSYELLTEVHKENDYAVKLLLLRIAKENCSYVLGEKELSLIEKNLHHGSIQIRTEILTILCTSPKKSEPVTSEELGLLKRFISVNLNIDSSPFQQRVLSQVRNLLVRIRDSLTQDFKLVLKKEHFDVSQLEFIEWLAKYMIQNTFPGANYQRRKMCLQITSILYDVFIISPIGLKRKEKPSKFVKPMIEWAQENNFWLFFKNDMVSNVLPCITDFTDEVRALSADLLLSYSSWPLLNDWNDIINEDVMKYALSLCNHPDYRNNDGGAHICRIIFNRLCNKISINQYHKVIEFLEHLVFITETQLKCAKENFLRASVNKPIHGMLLALQYCFSSSNYIIITLYQNYKLATVQLLERAMNMCFEIIHYMLKIMKGDNENENCPSFCDIGESLEKLVLSKKNTEFNDTLRVSNLDEVQFECSESDEHSSLSELLLSCCWHCIKNSCFLLCEISLLVLASSIESTLRDEMLSKISKELSSVLITCRHRGIVEACCEALNKFCLNLQQHKQIYESITFGLLQTAFETFDDSCTVSVTRRSAGYPLLFQAVVSSEKNNINRKLLPFTIKNLLNLINKPLPPEENISDKSDLPQAHAYHILKALISDASLSQCILPYYDSIIPVCISGFSSAVWSIRNGALQLFGVILPRVCGQKKVRDDDSEHNLISAVELFARCPSLKTYLLFELEKCIKFHLEKKLCSELVPILAILVKLMPQQKEQRQFMNDFKPLLMKLIDIPVWKVRDLISTALSIMVGISEVMTILQEVRMMLENLSVNANKAHSLLLIFLKFVKRGHNIPPYNTFIEEDVKKIYISLKAQKRYPLLLGIIIEIMMEVLPVEKDIFIQRPYNKDINNEVGLLFYESKAVLAHLKLSSLGDLPASLKIFSQANKHIQIVCLQFVSEMLLSHQSWPFHPNKKYAEEWKGLFVSVADYVCPENHPSVIKEALDFMINFSNHQHFGQMIQGSTMNYAFARFSYLLNMESGLTVSALSFVMWSIYIKGLLGNSKQNLYLDKWKLMFNAYCQPRSSDILRMQAARSLAILGPSLAAYLSLKCEKNVDSAIELFTGLCEGSILLLQDEDEEIRNEACKFPSQITQDYSVGSLQFNLGIQVVFDYMQQILSSKPFYLLYLWNRLQNYPSTSKVLQSFNKKRKIGLFEQEYINVFAEPQQLLIHYYTNFKKTLVYLSKENIEIMEYVSMFMKDVSVELEDTCVILSLINSGILNQSFYYHHQVFLALKKLKCQVSALLEIKLYIQPTHLFLNELDHLIEKWESVEEKLPCITVWHLNNL